jgi:hypothetical protein
MTSFFTIPDPDLSQESSVDPMGLQVIWTHYGQNIFGEKLTTIANDLRIFTFNLFHNHLINRLYQDHTEELQEAKAYYKTWQTEVDVKAGLLMFIEDMVTHVFYNNVGDDSNIEKLGILGISKARTLYNSYEHDKIFLAANKRMGVLKNQLNLGMTGRYKGPMMNMQFFDRSFTYIPKTWDQVNKFMVKWADAMELEENIIKLITRYLFQSGKKEYPQLSFQELKSNKLWKPISEGYLKCFGSRKLPKEIREYWKDRIGLTSGAPEALFKEMSLRDPNEYINHQQMFLNAKKHLSNEPTELKKVNEILALEPFLSHTEFLLRYIAQPNIKKFKDEEKNLELLRREIDAANQFSLVNVNPRLMELQLVMQNTKTLYDWLAGILSYHKKIMTLRGGNIWIEIDEKNNFKHYFAPLLSEKLNTIPKYLKERPWWHTYYLETLSSIQSGLN